MSFLRYRVRSKFTLGPIEQQVSADEELLFDAVKQVLTVRGVSYPGASWFTKSVTSQLDLLGEVPDEETSAVPFAPVLTVSDLTALRSCSEVAFREGTFRTERIAFVESELSFYIFKPGEFITGPSHVTTKVSFGTWIRQGGFTQHGRISGSGSESILVTLPVVMPTPYYSVFLSPLTPKNLWVLPISLKPASFMITSTEVLGKSDSVFWRIDY